MSPVIADKVGGFDDEAAVFADGERQSRAEVLTEAS